MRTHATRSSGRGLLIHGIILLAGFVCLVSFAHAQPADPLHITFTNATYQNNDHVYVWVDAGAHNIKIHGTETPLELKTSYKLSDLSAGLDVYGITSGRIYFSLEGEIGELQPGVDADFRYDFMEITYNQQPGDVADLSSMDQFGIPLTLQLKRNGVNLTGPNTHAGWKGYTDQEIVAALTQIATPKNANAVNKMNQANQPYFARIIGATDIHQRSLYHPQGMVDYVQAIQQSGHSIILKSSDNGGLDNEGYEYTAAFDNEGNWILTRVSGNGEEEIVIHAMTPWGPNPADPVLSIAEQINASDPKISIGMDGPIVSASDTSIVTIQGSSAVRDLFAALNLGYINSTHQITSDDIADPEKYGYLIGKQVYELNSWEMRQLTAAFDEVNTSYNIYANAIKNLSDSYGFAYSDWNENLTKVALLPGALHDGVYADELNITISASHFHVVSERLSQNLILA